MERVPDRETFRGRCEARDDETDAGAVGVWGEGEGRVRYGGGFGVLETGMKAAFQICKSFTFEHRLT